MKTFSTGLVCLTLLAQAAVADAAPIVLGKNEAVAEPRRDPGTGVCGSLTKFVTPPLPVQTPADATVILNKPPSDPSVANRATRLFQKMDFSVGVTSEGDFRAPAYSSDIFPYCQDPGAVPPGPDDDNLAMRVRGYLNVTDTNSGQPITFVLHCDDGCVLRIGKSNQQIVQADAAGPLTKRRARWVTFTEPGLYPIELVYFQNSATGTFEWSQARSGVFGSDDVAVTDSMWGTAQSSFEIVHPTRLFSAVVGNNASCSECGTPGMDCTTGSYCGNGLCQLCNVSKHCGASCTACPSTKGICAAGKCVQCTGAQDCAVGEVCDRTSGSCLPPSPCSTSAQCPDGMWCQSNGFCGNADTSCRADQECRGGEVCACPGAAVRCDVRFCFPPVPECTTDAQCGAEQACDSATQRCVPGVLTGGCQSASGARRIPDGWLFGLALVAGLGIVTRRRATPTA